MSNIRHKRNPYLKHTFNGLLLTGAVLLILANVSNYYILERRTFGFAQESVQAIAINVASNIPASLHESLTEVSQQNSDEYKVIENYFQIVTDSNPRVEDVYTLRPTADPNIFTFVVSAMEDEDLNNDGIIEQHELKPKIGEKYDASDQPDLRAAFDGVPTADSHVTFDKWGAWVSGYAPIKDVSGKVVAIVGADVAARYITDQRTQIMQSILMIDIFALPIIFFVAYVIARRLTREFNILAEGMDQLAHGNIDYELPLQYKGRGGVFKILFHDMVAMFKNLKAEAEEKQNDKNS